MFYFLTNDQVHYKRMIVRNLSRVKEYYTEIAELPFVYSIIADIIHMDKFN